MKILKAPIRVLQYIFFLGSGSLICNHELYSQPFAVGTRLIDGNFQCLSLNDLGLFLQRRIRATANTTGATWEFPKTCAYPGDVWRPYVPGTPPVPFNTIMDPATAPNSARFNAANGGASGTFAPGTAGRYYTFNVEDKVGT
ncbi:MAG: hypothetical protein N2747_11665, partial [Chitinophagaceae bacterium]|nr:hypothetical protein [Chitinophagaceae bacterium]